MSVTYILVSIYQCQTHLFILILCYFITHYQRQFTESFGPIGHKESNPVLVFSHSETILPLELATIINHLRTLLL